MPSFRLMFPILVLPVLLSPTQLGCRHDTYLVKLVDTADGSGPGEVGVAAVPADPDDEPGDDPDDSAEPVDTSPPIPPEDCDGLDNDGDGAVDEGIDCDTVTVDVPGSTYLFSRVHMDWPSAQAFCQDQGMDLVTVDDAEENDILHELVWDGEDHIGIINNPVWIGYHDDGAGWAWVSGEPNGYEYFSGEIIVDDWGTATYGQSAAWADPKVSHWQQAPGSWAYAFVCELQSAK